MYRVTDEIQKYMKLSFHTKIREIEFSTLLFIYPINFL
jgi:hypothetical protein